MANAAYNPQLKKYSSKYVTNSLIIEKFEKQKSNFFEKNNNNEIKTYQSNNFDVEFRIFISTLNSFLNFTKEYLDEIDEEIKTLSLRTKKKIRKKVIKSIENEFAEYQNNLYSKLNDIYVRSSNEQKKIYRNYYASAIRKHYMSSSFGRRALEKPFGYPGDYLQILMLFINENFNNLSLYDQLVSKFVINIDPCIAHRNRIDYLLNTLKNLAIDKKSKDDKFMFASIGCGPAIEVQKFANEKFSNNSCGMLIDMDERALTYCKNKLNKILQKSKSNLSLTYMQHNVLHLLNDNFLGEKYDFIYCAGLFDYLRDYICIKLLKNLYNQLKPNGLLVFTNIKNNRYNFFTEAYTDWFMIKREKEELIKLCNFIDKKNITILTEKMNTNLFIEISK